MSSKYPSDIEISISSWLLSNDLPIQCWGDILPILILRYQWADVGTMFLFDPLSERRMYSDKADIQGISRGGYHVSWVYALDGPALCPA